MLQIGKEYYVLFGIWTKFFMYVNGLLQSPMDFFTSLGTLCD
jgi:hypothetical protein